MKNNLKKKNLSKRQQIRVCEILLNTITMKQSKLTKRIIIS